MRLANLGSVWFGKKYREKLFFSEKYFSVRLIPCKLIFS